MLFVLLIHNTVLLIAAAQMNLTPFGKATQSSNIGGAGPNNAINPPRTNEFGYSNCTHTLLHQNEAWWMFEFFKSSYITEITIYYREHNMASDGLVWQDPSGYQQANLANDGIKATCSKTKGSTVTFHVDLMAKSIVTGMYIILGGMLLKNTYSY
ncbi:unnamed protein product [Mytilus coruscus]|uniref:Fucolectin tachylectin-4 pentraxin-1 domain-containing protein n=1 Tax=Mytilus coruscus TaxID=42192 RepID=A0A6J8CK14_MYTCO|nr:unnamed protein product [Mytilus coruscus]